MAVKNINKTQLQDIGNTFRLPGEVKSWSELHDGTSNVSYVVTYSTKKQYLFHQVSLREGVSPEAVMKNVDLVTAHLEKKNLRALHFHHTNLNENYTCIDGVYWRVLKYFDSEPINAEDPIALKNIGLAVASFQEALVDFDVTSLSDTFGDRHDTRALFNAVKESNNELELKNYLTGIEDKACEVFDLYKSGEIPARVTHNHTKVQNVLFNKDTKQPMVMIDLDAVMPGISLYDMATAALSATRQQDGDKASIDLSKLEPFMFGYLTIAKKFLTEKEISLIPEAIFAAAAEAAAFNFARYITNSKEKRLNKANLYASLANDIDAKLEDIRSIVDKALKDAKEAPLDLNAFERDIPLKDQKVNYKAGEYMPIIMPHKVTVKGGKCYAFFKRAFDIFCSLVALIVFSPLLLVVGLLVVITSPGPMIYVSKRVGQNGRIFYFYKFRSMYKDAEKRLDELLAKNEVEGGITFKMKDDPRITPFGKFIRKTSLDELPQLVNILKGDMSIIGPRVGLPREVELYPEEALDRLLVPQGLSGEWQANGRSDTTFDGMIKLDLDYVQNKRGFWHDIGLIFKTIWVVLTGKGAE